MEVDPRLPKEPTAVREGENGSGSFPLHLPRHRFHIHHPNLSCDCATVGLTLESVEEVGDTRMRDKLSPVLEQLSQPI